VRYRGILLVSRNLKLDCGDFGSKLALRPLAETERNLLTFSQRLESFGLDAGVMDKNILPAILWGNETVPLCIIEPFYGSLFFGHYVLLVLGLLIVGFEWILRRNYQNLRLPHFNAPAAL